ncbi:MAG: cell division protein ZapB [Acidobacteria bacterium]|nr:MAG: cell division protein ZapB [Acidobacteriota bacterium]
MTEGALARLEETVARVVALLTKVQAENSELRAVIQQLKDDVEELKRENCSKGELIEKLENDRLEIRSRVEKIITKIGTLEKPVGEASYRME